MLQNMALAKWENCLQNNIENLNCVLDQPSVSVYMLIIEYRLNSMSVHPYLKCFCHMCSDYIMCDCTYLCMCSCVCDYTATYCMCQCFYG